MRHLLRSYLLGMAMEIWSIWSTWLREVFSMSYMVCWTEGLNLPRVGHPAKWCRIASYTFNSNRKKTPLRVKIDVPSPLVNSSDFEGGHFLH